MGCKKKNKNLEQPTILKLARLNIFASLILPAEFVKFTFQSSHFLELSIKIEITKVSHKYRAGSVCKVDKRVKLFRIKGLQALWYFLIFTI
jgi:hypothetical protein